MKGFFLRMKSTWSIVFLLAFLLVSCKGVQTLSSKWATESEEPTSFRFYDPKSKVRYDVRNDSANLYVKLDVIDPKTRFKKNKKVFINLIFQY